MQLYGRAWTRRELEARVGRVEQVGGVRRMLLAEGPEAGVEQIQVRTGAGLTYYVSPSRGLDIGLAEWCGAPLSWQSPNGEQHPAFGSAVGMEWLRTAAGGLLMTCGLRQVGSPNVDQGEQLGLHGRAHHTPARQVAATGGWEGDSYIMRVAGVVEEVRLFGEYLRLSRAIRSTLGENRISISDTVENLGFAPTPLMLLYHVNLGFPLLDEQTTVRFPSRRVLARDEGTPVEGYERWQAPEAGYAERVYYHEGLEGTRAEVLVTNPAFPLGGGQVPLTLRIGWSPQELPRLVQWKLAGEGMHVLGVEPANCYVEGRAAERQRGTLASLAPGEARSFNLELSIEV